MHSPKAFPLRGMTFVGRASAPDAWNYNQSVTEIPVGDYHPGAFAATRRYHRHEGVDLYCNEGTVVQSCEPGKVIDVIEFTGEHAGSPWWNNTWAVVVQHEDFIGLYGELVPDVVIGDTVQAGTQLGVILQVIKIPKCRPTCMLHFEMYELDAPEVAVDWLILHDKPVGLLNPTDYLIECSNHIMQLLASTSETRAKV